MGPKTYKNAFIYLRRFDRKNNLLLLPKTGQMMLPLVACTQKWGEKKV